ncbi:hypothetical protein BDZ97DRAFT_1919603 [Flammula alnicola]|nr:hypothetical protein BDZ97DRAFT_1919603 [Flammula alnicola]
MTTFPVQSPISINLEAEKTRAFIKEFQKPLDGITAALDALHGQTMQIALLGEVGTKQSISELREQMRNQDERHKDGLVEIQTILDDLLKNQVVENMRKQVEEEITNQIDELVREQVAECLLKDHIPPELQEEFASSKRELEELNLKLHNSESRRANGKLRSNKPNESLATMFMADGNVSPLYPKDLKGLFSLDGDKTKALMAAYELPDPSESRDHNLNRFMQFCGVRYQLVE